MNSRRKTQTTDSNRNSRSNHSNHSSRKAPKRRTDIRWLEPAVQAGVLCTRSAGRVCLSRFRERVRLELLPALIHIGSSKQLYGQAFVAGVALLGGSCDSEKRILVLGFKRERFAIGRLGLAFHAEPLKAKGEM